MRTLITTLLVFACSSTLADVQYTETKDDFSNDTVYSVRITTTQNEPAVLFLSCYPGNKLDIQLAIAGTMFPDDVTDRGMLISTTHKFDKAESAVTSNWFMNLMKYENSWYRGDEVEFIKDAMRSNQLNIRLNKRNDIFRFGLKGTAVHLKKILNECTAIPTVEEGIKNKPLIPSELKTYAPLIRQKVSRNWQRPPGVSSRLKSVVRVRLVPGGEVLEVKTVRGSGNPQFDRSVEAAVYRASPLPLPADPNLFEYFREIEFLFSPD